MNVVVLQGVLSTPPRHRPLPSGSSLVQLEVRVERADGSRTNVPVVVPGPAEATARLPAGAAVTVVGSVHRRFFRAGGATASRTEVVADRVVPSGRAVAVRRALAAAVEAVSAPTSGPGAGGG